MRVKLNIGYSSVFKCESVSFNIDVVPRKGDYFNVADIVSNEIYNEILNNCDSDGGIEAVVFKVLICKDVYGFYYEVNSFVEEEK